MSFFGATKKANRNSSFIEKVQGKYLKEIEWENQTENRHNLA